VVVRCDQTSKKGVAVVQCTRHPIITVFIYDTRGEFAAPGIEVGTAIIKNGAIQVALAVRIIYEFTTNTFTATVCSLTAFIASLEGRVYTAGRGATGVEGTVILVIAITVDCADGLVRTEHGNITAAIAI